MKNSARRFNFDNRVGEAQLVAKIPNFSHLKGSADFRISENAKITSFYKVLRFEASSRDRINMTKFWLEHDRKFFYNDES